MLPVLIDTDTRLHCKVLSISVSNKILKSTLTILFIINIFIQKEHTAAPLWSFIGIGLEITVTPDDLKTAYIL